MPVQPNGKHIRSLRESAGLTAADLAEKAGLSERTILSVEKGASSYPGTVKRIAEQLKVKPDDLLRAPNPRVTLKMELVVPIEEMIEPLDVNCAVEELRRTFSPQHEVRVLDIERGSTLLVLEVDEEDAKRITAQIAAPSGLSYLKLGDDNPGEAGDKVWRKRSRRCELICAVMIGDKMYSI